MCNVNKNSCSENVNNLSDITDIAIASDHAGYTLKQYILRELQQQKYIVKDAGCYDANPVDYPDLAIKVAEMVVNRQAKKGILICGSGTGMSITANKIKEIRAANCFNTQMAALAVQHNNVNILCLGARIIPQTECIEIVNTFLTSVFEGGRHQKRLEKIKMYENTQTPYA